MPSPSAMQWDTMFQAYAICTLVLYLKYFVTSLYAADQDNHPEGNDTQLIRKFAEITGRYSL